MCPVKNSAITRFIANDVSLLQIKSCDLNVPSSSMDEPTSAYSEPSQGSTASFMDYFERAFSAEGILGSYVILPFDRDGFNNVIIYFGKICGVNKVQPSGRKKSTVIAVSPRHEKKMVGQTVSLAAETFSVDAAVPDDMDLYHPYYYAPSDAEELKKRHCTFLQTATC